MTRRTPRKAWPALVAAACLVAASLAQATGIDQLHAFLAGARTGTTTFRQIVAAKGRGAPQISTGTFAFQRPGRFRWVYEQPYEQVIVGDGGKLWIYDRDLNQVIVRSLDAALGGSPAALLAGDNALEQHFTIVDAGARDGIEYIDARPKTPDTGFERVRIGFRDNLPRRMELTDTFGNVTTLDFGGFERNAPLDASLFRFVPPKGADVVGE
jgi:outer membrane lipoprotein carrier protein